MGEPVKKRPPKARPERDDAYLEHVRAQPCCMKWLGGCSGRVRPHHHGKAAGGGGTSLKPSDYRTVPLCDSHHVDYHSGELSRDLADGGFDSSPDAYFYPEMVRCLESYLMGGTKPSKIMPRLKPERMFA